MLSNGRTVERLVRSRVVRSKAAIVVSSLFVGTVVLLLSLVLQWFVYNEVLHRSDPLRAIGSTIAAVVASLFVCHWQTELRRKDLEAMRRFEVIRNMNDKIRNALQAIECLAYTTNQEALNGIQTAVGSIDAVLAGVVAESQEVAPGLPPKKRSQTA